MGSRSGVEELIAVAPASARAADLLDAAGRLFARQGIARTTMEEIAQQAAAGKATLYRHFENKQAVVGALVERETARLARRLQRVLAGPEPVPDRLEEAFVAGLDFLRTHPLLAGGLRRDAEVLLPFLTSSDGPVARALLPLFATTIAEGVADGQLRSLRADWAAETLFRLLLSFLASPALGVALDDPAEVRAYAHGLIAAGTAAGTAA